MMKGNCGSGGCRTDGIAKDGIASGETALDGSARSIIVLIVVGMLVGVLSGMFGIGGGTVIVPALVWLGLSQRNAAATSTLAIVPTSISGVVSYATGGHVDWLAAVLLFCGMFVGGQIGSWLLSRLPELVLRWIFVAFLVFVVINQVSFVPSRDHQIVMTVVTGIGLALLGVVIGTLAGLLGIGVVRLRCRRCRCCLARPTWLRAALRCWQCFRIRSRPARRT